MPYVARKPITLSGRRFGAGEVVPLGDLGLMPKTVRQLLDTRKLLMTRDAARPTPKEERPALTPKAEVQRLAPKKAPPKRKGNKQRPVSGE